LSSFKLRPVLAGAGAFLTRRFTDFFFAGFGAGRRALLRFVVADFFVFFFATGQMPPIET
jgi:hypothetical protein